MMKFAQIPAPDLVAANNAAISKAVDTFNDLIHMPLNKLLQTLLNDAMMLFKDLLICLIVYYVGRWVIKRILNIMRKMMIRRKVDASIMSFALSIMKATLVIILMIALVGILGLNTTSFVAIFASAGLAIGMALSGTLQNFAGGVIILLFKPYKVGDTIEAQGQTGMVKEIKLFDTVLRTADNKVIYIPNGSLSTGIINNYSKETVRRAEWTFLVGYGSDLDKIKQEINKILSDESRIIQDREKLVTINSLMDSMGVTMLVRAWTSSAELSDVTYDIGDKIYKIFETDGIEIPKSKFNATRS